LPPGSRLLPGRHRESRLGGTPGAGRRGEPEGRIVTASGEDAADRMTFVAGSGVIDSTGSGLRRGEGVLIRAGRVVDVGTAGNVAPADAVRVDAGAAVIVPGFIDS